MLLLRHNIACFSRTASRSAGDHYAHSLHRSCLRPLAQSSRRSMAASDQRSNLSHEERTANSLRDPSLHTVTLSDITYANKSIRLLRLSPIDKSKSVNFLPGQWLDVFVPGVPKAGGFTITSAPHVAAPSSSEHPEPHLELAVQHSPKNPPAAWLWRDPSEILGSTLAVRVGGEFVWPPNLDGKPGAEEWSRTPLEQRHVVMLAGGVGINPLMSMISHIHHERTRLGSLTLLYSTKNPTTRDGTDILFMSRIKALTSNDGGGHELRVRLFFTAPPTTSTQGRGDNVGLPVKNSRITLRDLELAMPEPQARGATVCYVCGPKAFTDGFVEALGRFEGMHPDRVLCERWW